MIVIAIHTINHDRILLGANQCGCSGFAVKKICAEGKMGPAGRAFPAQPPPLAAFSAKRKPRSCGVCVCTPCCQLHSMMQPGHRGERRRPSRGSGSGGRWYISREARRTTDSAASPVGQREAAQWRLREGMGGKTSQPAVDAVGGNAARFQIAAMAMPPAWKLSTALASVAERSVAMRICTASRPYRW